MLWGIVLLAGALAVAQVQSEDAVAEIQRPQNKPCKDPNAERVQCAPDPSCRSTCATPNPSPCRKICAINQCACKKGYVLSKKGGKCIPVDQCPKDVPCNGDCNAVIKANPIPCPSTCSAPNASPLCKRYAPPVGCECKPGYLLNDKDKCITPDQCPAPPIKCKENEVYNPCSFICPPQTCASLYTDYDCRGATKCVPGCDCIPEYLRNGTENDPCIPSHLCPTFTPECGINEHYETNRIKCELTCKNYHLEPIMGPCQPTSACFCDDGYVRNSNGLCILKKECPPAECDKGEVYSECGSSCPPSCENKGNTCLVCTAQCVPGCFCAKGTIRAPNNTCVKPENCPKPQCGRNEEFVKCPRTCPRTDECKNLWSKEPCTPIDCCHPQCRCKSGFYRKNGVCVSARECSR
ncbi:zonadhesin-like [Cydia amplana]|uniref:zonadhesin-like n=1 Tax=Cydia amplana TaxID=1869771 RepID=UPI002FE55DC8